MNKITHFYEKNQFCFVNKKTKKFNFINKINELPLINNYNNNNSNCTYINKFMTCMNKIFHFHEQQN